jgi:hypothetical protein
MAGYSDERLKYAENRIAKLREAWRDMPKKAEQYMEMLSLEGSSTEPCKEILRSMTNAEIDYLIEMNPSVHSKMFYASFKKA